MGHPNIPPATGSIASGKYIIYGVVTGGGSNYNLQLKLETAKSRELVKEFNIPFAVGFEPITTGYNAASNFGPLYTTCLDFEKKKRDEGTRNHSVNFNASGLKPGFYFCKLCGDGFSSFRKMLMIR